MSAIVNTGNKIGRGIAGVRLVAMSLFALSLVISATALVFKKNRYTASTNGKVLAKECTERCSVEYEYTVGDKTYKKKTVTPGKESLGDVVEVHYVPESPGDATLKVMPTKTIGVALYGFALVMFCLAFLTYTITKRVKGAGTLLTASTAFSLFT